VNREGKVLGQVFRNRQRHGRRWRSLQGRIHGVFEIPAPV